MHVFGIDYPKTDDIRLRRAYSWKYQREIVKATPAPKNNIFVRFEDMVFDQDKTLARLSDYLGIPVAKIPMRTDSVGRWKTDNETHIYDFFKEDMDECGYN